MDPLIFYTSTNRKGKNDAKGAFIPEAEAFAELHGISKSHLIAVPQDIPVIQRRRIFREVCKKYSDIDTLVYFGHGTKASLPGIGVNNYNLKYCLDYIKGCSADRLTVVLYACLAGKGLGIADKLYQGLEEYVGSLKVVSHLSSGHTSWNPYGEYSGIGINGAGEMIIEKTDPLWGKWVSELKSNREFRLSFPFWTRERIQEYLEYGYSTVVTCPTCGGTGTIRN